MKRHRQTVEELLAHLTSVKTSWMDPHAEAVIRRLRQLVMKKTYTRADLAQLFSVEKLPANTKRRLHFEESLTIVRHFLDMSKDEFTTALRTQLGAAANITRLKKDPDGFFAGLEAMGVLARIAAIVNEPVTWCAVLTERLKGGRGSAIKGQRRGRFLEDFVEESLRRVFGRTGYEARCQFRGAKGESKEKTDFAIPSKDDPAILIEVKAYGATGSKQTDVLGDITRIITEKRSDTDFLLVTDGVTWRDRVNDLRKLVALQNQGSIARIYTQSMANQLNGDLKQLKQDHRL